MTKNRVTQTKTIIGQRFRALRIDSKLSQSEAARAMDIPRSTLTSIESGRSLPSLILAGRIAAFYQAPVDFILTGKGLDRQLQMPREAANLLKELMKPIDLVVEQRGSKTGFLTLKVKDVVPGSWKQGLVRSAPKPADRVFSLAELAQMTDADIVNEIRKPGVAGFLKLKPSVAPAPRRKPGKKKFDLGFSEV